LPHTTTQKSASHNKTYHGHSSSNMGKRTPLAHTISCPSDSTQSTLGCGTTQCCDTTSGVCTPNIYGACVCFDYNGPTGSNFTFMGNCLNGGAITVRSPFSPSLHLLHLPHISIAYLVLSPLGRPGLILLAFSFLKCSNKLRRC
jgi:hypothetical protein